MSRPRRRGRDINGVLFIFQPTFNTFLASPGFG